MDIPVHERFPGIAKATLLIALDNGGINRTRSEEQQKEDLAAFLSTWDPKGDLLDLINNWLSDLPEDQLETVCCGETTEMAKAMKGAPFGADSFLNDYFNQVC